MCLDLKKKPSQHTYFKFLAFKDNLTELFKKTHKLSVIKFSHLTTKLFINQLMQCQSCKSFSNDPLKHYRTEWHIHNVRLKCANRPPLTLEEFDSYCLRSLINFHL